jgi:hypothetical protein
MMAEKKKLFTPWSTLGSMLGKMPTWWPAEEQQRIAAYEKYDQMYWNDPTQYAIRVLEDEQPLYVPNARIVVDTVAQYLMKGFRVIAKGGSKEADSDEHPVLKAFFDRERFYSKFHLNKLSGITRGDSAFHIVANPAKEEGSRISIDTLHPGMVWRIKDEEGDDPDKVIRVHIVDQYQDAKDPTKIYIRKLTYEREEPEGGGTATIYREEAIYEIEPEWWGPAPKKYKTILNREAMDPRITQIPVYWFPNLEWESQDYGSSELRGLEFLDWAVSQGATDTEMALALEGLGVYATDGGRPVGADGREEDWEVSPGKVMEVPAGSYFRRVEGVTSITPMMEQIKYLESKMFSGTGLTDVAMGQVDVQVAQSGIALAIKFLPTLAKIEPRDVAYKEILQQMFHDLIPWFEVFEKVTFPEVEILIDEDKLPLDRTAILNELNNMLDRKIISRKTFRKLVKKLGYTIDDDEEEKQIAKEAEASAKLAALTAPPGLQQNAEDAAAGRKPITNATGGNNDKVDKSGNQSNNGSRPNESAGTEATQTPQRQAAQKP